MSAPIIWILFPGFLSAVLWLLRKKRQLTLWIAVSASSILAILAASVPISATIKLGAFSIQVNPELLILGRRLILSEGDRGLLGLLFTLSAVWFVFSAIAAPNHLFAPFGLGTVTLLVAAIAVEPFYYAALLVELAVLFTIPILVRPGQPLARGIQRYLIFQTLAVPTVLFAGWLMERLEVDPSNSQLVFLAAIFLGLGFAFWLAVFPFYSWLPRITEESEPISAGFALSVLSTSVLLLGLDFINAFGWLRASSVFSSILQLVGILMIVTSGIWAAFQQDISRLLGYILIYEAGFALLTAGLPEPENYPLFVASFGPRLVALLVFTLALTVIRRQSKGTRLANIHGVMLQTPVAGTALLLSYFSIGGVPLLAEFPIRLEVLKQLGGISIPALIWVLVGGAGFLLSGVRIMADMVKSEKQEWQSLETFGEKVLFGISIAALIFMGLFPDTFLRPIVNILQAFPALIQ